MTATDTNTQRLEAIEDRLDDLDDRIDAQHRDATNRNYDRFAGDPSKLFEDQPPQALLLAAGAAENETALGLADEARDALSTVRTELDRIGPPEQGLFNDADAALDRLTQHLEAVNASLDEDDLDADL